MTRSKGSSPNVSATVADNQMTFHAEWKKAARATVARATPVAILFAVGQWWIGSTLGGRDGPLALVPLVIVTIGFVTDYLDRVTTAIEVTAHDIVVSSIVRGRRVYPRRDISGLALRRVTRYARAQSIGVVHRIDGRAVATLPEAFWSIPSLRRLQAMLGSRDVDFKDVSSTAYDAEFPGASRAAWGWVLAIAVGVSIIVGATIQNR